MSMQNAGAPAPSDAKTWAIVVWALYLGGIVTGLSGIVGIILAYVKRGDLVGTPFESHMTSAIRTFWISLIGVVIGIVLAFIGIGFLILLAVTIWFLFRSIRGLVLAIESKPIANPTGWL